MAVALAALLSPELSSAQRQAEPAQFQVEQFDPSDAYFQGCLATRDAEKLESDGDLVGADEKYSRAKKIFDAIRMHYPDWKPDMVKCRQKKTDEAIVRIRR